MFVRTIIITSLNGFEKVTQTEKRRLAAALNTMTSDINGKAKATINSLDCVYRSDIFNTESEASMKRRDTLIEKLKAAKTDGISIEVFDIKEEVFASLPDEQKYMHARINAHQSFEI